MRTQLKIVVFAHKNKLLSPKEKMLSMYTFKNQEIKDITQVTMVQRIRNA